MSEEEIIPHCRSNKGWTEDERDQEWYCMWCSNPMKDTELGALWNGESYCCQECADEAMYSA